MSLYLGKIHFWLFDKILWFEGLEEEIINLGASKDLDIEGLKIKVEKKYGAKLESNNLEEIIDQSNIHGWLQEKIHSAEGRMAAYTKAIFEKDGNLEDLEKVYVNQGIKAGKEAKLKEQFSNAKEIYKGINDYILDGMPCDRVDVVSVSEEDEVKWSKRICVHKEIFEKEGVDVSIFYTLRDAWIKAFVNAVNNNFEFKILEDKSYEIVKK